MYGGSGEKRAAVPFSPSVSLLTKRLAICASEAMAMAKDAIEGYLATMRERGWKLPSVRRERVAITG
jgi:hypothetical protein